MNTRTWMWNNVELFTDKITGEVNEVGLAELFCEETGRALEPDGTAPDGIYKISNQVARAYEMKTGAIPYKVSPVIGEFMNHVDSNFQFPKVSSR